MAKYGWEKLKPGTGTSAANPCVWVLDEEKTREHWPKAEVKDGVIRWKSNGSVPPEDCMAAFLALGFKFDLAKSNAARKKDLDAFFKDYKKRQPKQPSAEERFEAGAAFGRGVEVVDVISGRKFRT